MVKEYTELYENKDKEIVVPSLPKFVHEFKVDDEPMFEAEIRAVVRKMKRNKAAGPTGLTTNTVKDWEQDFQSQYIQPFQKKKPLVLTDEQRTEMERVMSAHPWSKVVDLVIEISDKGDVPEGMANSYLVLFPKGDAGQHHGIGLMNTIWKIVTGVLSRRINHAVSFHHCVHEFIPEKGTSTAILEVKLMNTLAAQMHGTVYQVFLDVSKVYDSVSRKRLLELMENYGIGEKMRTLMANFWEKQKLVIKQGHYFSSEFRPFRGVTQGDCVSPTLFNLIVDTVVQIIAKDIRETEGQEIHSMSVFYADDGMIGGTDPWRVQ